MRNSGFTLIELLAVLVILAIIALIATPVVLNIISDSKEESNKRSIEMYAKALQNSIAKYQLSGKELGVSKLETTDGRNFSNIDDFKVDYEGNVVCDVIEVYVDGNMYLDKCKVNSEQVEYAYGKKASFSDDSWDTIAKNVKAGYMYEVGETKEVCLESFTNLEPESNGLYTVRIANNTKPEECNMEGFSQSSCGFVVEFEDIITEHSINPSGIYKGVQYHGGWNIDGYPASKMYTYIKNDIYNSLPKILKKIIIDTNVVSSHGSTSGESNFISTDKLYLLSRMEVYGSNSMDADTSSKHTRQLDYYKDVAKVTSTSYLGAVKRFNGSANKWWLRSAHAYNNNSYFEVDTNGSSYYSGSPETYGVSPSFRIG